MANYLLIALGGALGSLLRYLVQFCTVLFIFGNSELKLDLSLNIENSVLLILIYAAIIILF